MTKPRKSTPSRTKSVPRDKAPKKRGRPPIEIDLGQLETLAKIQCTYEEIAAVLRISPDTLSRNYAERIKEFRSAGKGSLRKAQWKAALGGNVTMQIWLGKNELGQSDKQELTGKDGKPLIPMSVTVRLVRPG